MARRLDVLLVVPARAGSKRFHEKNKATLGGKALWYLAVTCCLAVGRLLDILGVTWKVVVSSDDEEVLTARGLDSVLLPVAFLDRPAHLATDDATSEAVALHALEHYPADMVCLVQPTSPLRIPLDIVRCILACPAYTISRLNLVKYACTTPNGAVYTQLSEALKNDEAFNHGWNFTTMPAERSIDIDLPIDLVKAREYLES